MAARETDAQKLIRMTEIERELWAQGHVIAGMDEVGRGPLAGPVVTACVSMNADHLIPGVNDSKKVAEKKREKLFERIMAEADYVKIGWKDPDVIDSINILAATRRAMEECAADFAGSILLIDAVDGLRLPCESRSIIKGDANSYMIAAASIVAKVTRDRYMIELDEKYPMYGFARNKGYGTPEHIAALKEYGPCPAHRRSFIGNFVDLSKY